MFFHLLLELFANCQLLTACLAQGRDRATSLYFIFGPVLRPGRLLSFLFFNHLITANFPDLIFLPFSPFTT
jgi:hypothetical protein